MTNTRGTLVFLMYWVAAVTLLCIPLAGIWLASSQEEPPQVTTDAEPPEIVFVWDYPYAASEIILPTYENWPQSGEWLLTIEPTDEPDIWACSLVKQ